MERDISSDSLCSKTAAYTPQKAMQIRQDTWDGTRATALYVRSSIVYDVFINNIILNNSSEKEFLEFSQSEEFQKTVKELIAAENKSKDLIQPESEDYSMNC